MIIEFEKFKTMKALKELREHEIDLLKKYGWVVHHVLGLGSHTHGIWEAFGHPDIELAVAVHPEIAHGIICNAKTLIKDQPIEVGKRYSEILQNMDVLFIKSPTEENTLRLILPDPHGNLDFDTMKEPYKSQYLP